MQSSSDVKGEGVETKIKNPFIVYRQCPVCHEGIMEKKTRKVAGAWENERIREYFRCSKCFYEEEINFFSPTFG